MSSPRVCKREFRRTRLALAIFSIVLASELAGCKGGGGSSNTSTTTSSTTSAAQVVLQKIAISPNHYSVQVGFDVKLTVTGTYSDGSTKDLTASASWTSASLNVATVDNSGNATAIAIGQTTVQATAVSMVTSTTLTVTPVGSLKNAGLYTQIERRGYPSEYWSGQVIQNWNQFDSVVGSTTSQEVSLQLDNMKAMGVNTITFELRAADPTSTGNFTPPDCNIGPALGLQFPQPSSTELANLPLFFDMVESKGMKVWLRLVNTHMEQQPPTNSQTWLSAIFGAIGKHPALDLILFEGDAYTEPGPNGTVTCGIPAEPPLWLGPGSIPVTYVQWAINFGMSQGMPSRKLSAEAIVGSYFVENNPPAGSNATGGHLWSPIAVEKTIFDNLNIPANQRTYALSFYEHRKCVGAQSLPCTDLDAHDWADQTIQYVTSVTGAGPRIVAPEMGDLPPVDQVNWNTQHALESLVFLTHKYGLDGGSFWRWTSFMNSEDSDTTLAQAVKVRGVPFVYNMVQKEVVDMGGFHLPAVPNGSFEGSVSGNGVPVTWTANGVGTVSQYLLTQEPGEPEVPSRGIYAMRMVTGSGVSDSVTATSVNIPSCPRRPIPRPQTCALPGPETRTQSDQRRRVHKCSIRFCISSRTGRRHRYTLRIRLHISRRTALLVSPPFQCSTRHHLMQPSSRLGLARHATGCPLRSHST
jgi:Big-like domain-containing protein